MSSRQVLQRLFPGLRNTAFEITSPRDPSYNCIAWAAGDDRSFWWPGAFTYWPRRAVRQETLEAFIEMFQTLGYSRCLTDRFESGYEKIAIFADADKSPTHVARQLLDGRWTSKIGRLEDITHHNLGALAGTEYGRVAVLLRRQARSSPGGE